MFYGNRTRAGVWGAVAAFALLAVAGPVQAKLIDGQLGDWGVTPFSDWDPSGSAIFTEEDYHNGNFPYGGERFDVEAMYMDRDADHLYVAIVTGFPEAGLQDPYRPSVHVDAGDLLLDLDHSDGFQWEYGVLLNGADKGDVYYQPAWVLAQSSSGFPGEGPSNIDVANSGSPVGTATVAWHNYGDLEGYGSDTYGIEVAIDWDDLGDPSAGTTVFARHTMGCANDVIALQGLTPVPEPATLGLLLAGALFAGAARARRRLLRRARPSH